jgi:ABC-type multidrug transport system fused ATPase/permease subunit
MDCHRCDASSPSCCRSGIGIDQVVVFDKGKIIEKESPAALLGSEGSGVFREMVQMEI